MWHGIRITSTDGHAEAIMENEPVITRKTEKVTTVDTVDIHQLFEVDRTCDEWVTTALEMRALFQDSGESEVKRARRLKYLGLQRRHTVFGQEWCGIRCKTNGCRHVGCAEYPLFGNGPESERLYCPKHAPDSAVYVFSAGGCQRCPGAARYGPPGQAPTLCATHKQTPRHAADGTLIPVIRNPRAKCRCGEPAVCGTVEPKRCEACRIDGDRNLVERPCASCGLTFVLDPVSKLCEYCDPATFQTMRLRKQREVGQYLESHGLAPTSVDVVPPDLKSCGNRERPDFFYDRDAWCVVVEVDEHQHKGRPRECECTRVVNVTEALGRPTLWIRYNPDPYRPADGAGKEDLEPHELEPRERLPLLAGEVERALDQLPEAAGPRGAVMELFFDGYDGRHEWHALA